MSVSDSPQRNIDTHTLGGRRHSGRKGPCFLGLGNWAKSRGGYFSRD